jgi:hypothetical protein
MKQIVNVVLNSNYKTSGANNDAVFNFDFGAVLKDNTPYRLHWSYVGQSNVITAASKLAQIQINFGMEQYAAQSVLGAPTTYSIGGLRTNYVNGTINYLFADDNNNPPIYLPNRPYSNVITVQVLTNDNPPVLWKDNTATPVVNGNYILILSFQELGNDED